MVTQCVIICSTGRMSYVQMFSVSASLITLSCAASKMFFTMRGNENKEADPKLNMMLHVFPLMVASVTSSVITWTAVAGMVGEFTIIPAVLTFLVNLASLSLIKPGKREKKDD